MDTGPKQRRQMNPRYKANLFSILTFGWTMETFKMGYSRDIIESDLYGPLPEHQSNVLGDMLQNAWDVEVEKCRDTNRKPSLWKALTKVFGIELMLYGLILAALEFVIRLQQPLFLGLLLRYYSPTQELQNDTASNPKYLFRFFHYYDTDGAMTWGEAMFFACGVVFCSAVNVMVQHPFMMGAMHIGMKMRVAVCSLIYRKALKVNLQAMCDSSAGLVVNLLANDVNRFDTGPLFVHYLWIGPLETVFMTIALYQSMGMPAIYGAMVIVCIIPFQVFLGVRTAYYRIHTALVSDERVKLMKEIIMGMGVIKMYTWEYPFRKIVDCIRREEIYYIKMTSYIRGVIMSFIMFTSRFSIFVAVFLYVTLVNKISVETVFILTCYYNITKQTMTLYFPQAVGQISEMSVAVSRVRDYLLSEECNLLDREIIDLNDEPDNFPKKHVVIPIDPVQPFPPPPPQPHMIPNSSKTKVIDKDDLAIKFIDACSKWIISSTSTDAIDINLEIPARSLTTIIGSVGAGKSTLLHMILMELPCHAGSVEIKGSISYASQDPWLFVGSVRQNILFGRPFRKAKYMEVCKVCALERDLSLFPHGDKTIVGERGVSLSGGQRARINLARAVYKEADIYLLDDPLSAVDSHVAKHIFENCIKKFLGMKTVVLVTHQLQFIKTVDQIVVMDKGKVLDVGDFNELKEKDLDIINLMHSQTQTNVTPRESEAAILPSAISTVPSTFSNFRHRLSLFIETEEETRPVAEAQMTGRVGSKVYSDYFFFGNKRIYVFIVFIFFLLAQLFASASDYWLSLWSNAEDRLTGDQTMDNLIWAEQGLQRRHYGMIFALITLLTITVALTRAFLFFNQCMHSSIKLHDLMFECIARSPMSFFNTNSSGRILNRFSKDMGAVDELLPQAMIDCFQILLSLIGVIIVVLVADVALLVPIIATLIIFYIFRHIYIRTTGAVKRLEGITRSPVFGHINATVLGLATIRSFGAESLLAHEFDRHQDLHSAAWYLFITCSRAFGYYLDLICMIFILCVTFSCLMKTDISGSTVGLLITQSISLTGVFQWGMRQSAEMENQMTSVERILEYTNLPQEAELRSSKKEDIPPNWPTQGAIRFDNLSLKYTLDGSYVLNKLTLDIKPHEKIGIVGRTGAGKSSIIQALFRLAYLEGKIYIDDVDVTSIGLHDLREKISIIPQEPVLFSGTLRKNLDPFDQCPDDVLLEALNHVKLYAEDDDNENALYEEVAESGSNFSVGERQLVCLARAIVHKDNILVLDEATANVDAQTDSLIQSTIREHFSQCTVLTVAHRLNTIIDSDRVLVLDAGRVMEFDHPHILLQTERGYFRKMVSETGPAMTQLLREAAEESYNKLNETNNATS